MTAPTARSTCVFHRHRSSPRRRSSVSRQLSVACRGAGALGAASKTYRLERSRPETVSVRVSPLLEVQTAVSPNTPDGASAYRPSRPRASSNFGVRWTLVNRAAHAPKKASLLERASAALPPKAGAAGRQAGSASARAVMAVVMLRARAGRGDVTRMAVGGVAVDPVV